MISSATAMLDVKLRVGERCKQLRLASGLDVAHAAAAIRMSEPHLYAVERGEKWPSQDLLLVMSYVYGVDLADFYIFPDLNLRHQVRELLRLTPNAALPEVARSIQTILQTPTSALEIGPKKLTKRR